jgi:hypothetical protein
MLDIFCEWAQGISSNFIRSDTEVNFELGELCDNRSARLNIDTSTSVAEIVFWESGDYVAEIIDIESEKTLYSTSGVFSSGQRLEKIFSGFFENLGDQPF